MPQKTDVLTAEERAKRGQSVPLGDTGDGDTGVPDDEQGISNRPGDEDEDPDEMEPDADEDDDVGIMAKRISADGWLPASPTTPLVKEGSGLTPGTRFPHFAELGTSLLCRVSVGGAARQGTPADSGQRLSGKRMNGLARAGGQRIAPIFSNELPAHRLCRVASVGIQCPGQCQSDPAASTM